MAARSTRVTLENLAGRYNLRKTSDSLSHGIWTTRPPRLMGTKAEWRSESNGFATGTEGRVTYQIEDDTGVRVGEVRLHWNNPFVGSNSYGESVTPHATSATTPGFSIVHQGGGGDDAEVKFTLLGGFCQVSSSGNIFCSSSSHVGVGSGQRFAAIWDRTPSGPWFAVHDLTSSAYQQRFNELVGQGFRLVDVSGYAVGGQDRYAALFVKDGGPGFSARHGLTSAGYQQAFNELVAQGYRPVKVNGYGLGSQDFYAAIFEKRGGPAWVARHGLTSAGYQQTFNELVAQGFRPRHVSGYAVNNQDFYAAIFEKDGGPAFVARHGLTSAGYQKAFNEFVGQGFRLHQVSGYVVAGQDRYAAIFEKDGGPGFTARHGLTSAGYQQTFDQLAAQGYRLRQVSGYGQG